jgi:ABC-type bacteriocin/lantibiotic exporter with double-glycine peptidase domain
MKSPQRQTLRRLPLCVALLLGAALPGCAALEVRSPASFAYSGEAARLDVPLVSQESPNLCGLAALAMLTRYHRAFLSEANRESIAAAATRDQGTSGALLKSVLESEGYFVSVFQGSLDDEATGLYRHLRAGRPLIAMLSMGEYRHYVVVAGFDPVRDVLVVLDPVAGELAMRTRRFLAMWEKANRFTLLAVPRGRAAGEVVPFTQL